MAKLEVRAPQREHQSARPLPAQQVGDDLVLTTGEMRNKFEMPAGATNLNYRLLSRSNIRTFEVQHLGGNAVAVGATVDLMDQAKSLNYLWRLRVLKEDGSLHSDRPYAEQLFPMHRSGEMAPTFAEVLQLPPGAHKVLLNLYPVPNGYDLKNLADEVEADLRSLIHVHKVVEIPAA